MSTVLCVERAIMAAWAPLLFTVSAALVVVTEAAIAVSPPLTEPGVLITHDPLRSHVRVDAPAISHGITKDAILPARLVSQTAHSIRPDGQVVVHPPGHSVELSTIHFDDHSTAHPINHPTSNLVTHSGAPLGHPPTNIIPHPAAPLIKHPAGHPPAHPAPNFQPHPAPNFPAHPAPNVQPHPAPNFPAHPVPNVQPHPAPNFTAHPAPNVQPHPAPNFPAHPAPNFQPHPAPKFPDHPAPNFQPHSAPNFQPHPTPNFQSHPAPNFQPHPAPKFPDHPAPNFQPHPAPNFPDHPAPNIQPHPAPNFPDHPAPNIQPHPAPNFPDHHFGPSDGPQQPDMPLSSLHQMGYNPYTYKHPYPESNAHFPKHGYNVVKELDGDPRDHLNPQVFPGDGYDLDPYFDDFPGFGYFNSVPKYSMEHGLTDGPGPSLAPQSHIEEAIKDGPPLSRGDIENVKFKIHIPMEDVDHKSSAPQTDTHDASLVVQKPSEDQKPPLLSRVPRKVPHEPYFMDPPRMPSLPLVRTADKSPQYL